MQNLRRIFTTDNEVNVIPGLIYRNVAAIQRQFMICDLLPQSHIDVNKSISGIYLEGKEGRKMPTGLLSTSAPAKI